MWHLTHHFHCILNTLHSSRVLLVEVVPSLTDGLRLGDIVYVLKSATWLTSGLCDYLLDLLIILKMKLVITGKSA